LHNPVDDIYVVFIMEYDYKARGYRIYSRPYNNKGKPKGPFFHVQPITFRTKESAPAVNLIYYVDICYNSTENKFFLIWTYSDRDGIWGMELNSRGNREGVTTYTFTMKKQLNIGSSGGNPRILWMPDKDQYAMAWTFRDTSSNSISPKNGYYLSTFTSFLTPKKIQKKVRSGRIIHVLNGLSEFMLAGDKLLWGTVEPIDEKWSRPVVWITKSNGKILSPNLAIDSGAKYPGKKLRYGGHVRAGYDPVNKLFLLTWNAYSEVSPIIRKSQKNYYRIMDCDGNYIGRQKILPHVENFQINAEVTFDLNNNHFFVTCPEYKVLYAVSPSSIFQDCQASWGGQLWGYKIDSIGKQIGSRVPLTKVFTDVDTSFSFGGAFYNAIDDQHFLIYFTRKYMIYATKVYGLIYK